jgi:hypothetical protein
MKNTRMVVGVVGLVVLAGCGGTVRQIPMKDGAGVEKPVALPKGTIFGGASQEQAGAIAQIVADANTAAAERAVADVAATARVESAVQQVQADVHDLQASGKRDDESLRRLEAAQKRADEEQRQAAAATQEKIVQEAAKVDASVKRVVEGQTRLEETARETLDTAKKTWDTTKMIIEAFEKVSRRQGTGEVTVFFQRGSALIARGGLQERRLVDFADWLGRESRGRKIMFVAIGSASATGPQDLNTKLAKKRAEALLGVVDQYLVNVPHEYVKMYGTGDAYSPKGAPAAEHGRYQHARLIAFFEKGQEPALPAEP